MDIPEFDALFGPKSSGLFKRLENELEAETRAEEERLKVPQKSPQRTSGPVEPVEITEEMFEHLLIDIELIDCFEPELILPHKKCPNLTYQQYTETLNKLCAQFSGAKYIGFRAQIRKGSKEVDGTTATAARFLSCNSRRDVLLSEEFKKLFQDAIEALYK